MSDILTGTVVSSRIRLARNLKGHRFPAALDNFAEARDIINKTFRSLDRFGKFRFLKISEADPALVGALKERYIISDALIKSRIGAVAYSENGDLSVMVNEEDHIREQYLVRGGNLAGAFEKLSGLDKWLDVTLNFCRNERYGFITACPTNLGTGMRASMMTFLPAHVKLGKLDELNERAADLNLTVRGAFGEGSDGTGFLYQISNEVTLGRSEVSMINTVTQFVRDVAEHENDLQQVYYRSDEMQAQDEIFRSLGILLYCRRISYNEFLAALSNVKLGVSLGFIKVKSVSALDDLMVCARPCYLLELTNAEENSFASPVLRDEIRAKFVRERLGSLIVK